MQCENIQNAVILILTIATAIAFKVSSTINTFYLKIPSYEIDRYELVTVMLNSVILQ